MTTCFTGFVSSHTFGRLFGMAAMGSFVATYFLFTRALVSVWFFFAALLSVIVYLHLQYRTLGGLPHSDLLAQGGAEAATSVEG